MKTKKPKRYKTKVIVPEKPANEDITTLIARLADDVRKLARVKPTGNLPEMTDEEALKYVREL